MASRRSAIGNLFLGLVLSALLLAVALACPVAVGAEGDGAVSPPVGLEVFQRQEDLGLRVTLSWNQRPDAAGYYVYRAAKAEGPFERIGGMSSDTMLDYPFFLDDTAKGGKTYYYKVSAVDRAMKEGPPSAAVVANPPVYRRASGVGKSIICSLADQRVYFFENDVVVNILRCSTGTGGTPTGNYRILAHRGWVSGCAYWMDWRPNYGMHAWPSYLGSFEENLGVTPRSHGCIRLHPLEAYWPYNWAPDGTPLTVTYQSLGRLPLQGANCSTGSPKLSKTWYFAEGFTGGEFREYLMFFNPGGEQVNAKTTYYPEGAAPVTEVYGLPPGARQTIYVNGVSGLPGSGHATHVEADGEIVVERSDYFDYGGRRGGHSNIGITEPSREWYFAEGYTGGMFDTYILLFNPNPLPSRTICTFYPEGAAPVTQEYVLPPLYRGTTLVNAVPGCQGRGVACSITSERPVVAEETEYFAMGLMPNGINGGECTSGLPRAGKTWYLAEGCTHSFFDEYILILNPGGTTVTVNCEFYPATGPYGIQVQVAPYSRGTISVDAIPGLEAAETGATITSDQPIVVERTMYYSRDSRRGGHATNGVPELSKDWYFAEGYTGGSFEEYILLLNPSDAIATASFVFHVEGGADVPYACQIPPKRRLTVHVDEIPGVSWIGNATEVHCDQPIVAERAQYFCIPR